MYWSTTFSVSIGGSPSSMGSWPELGRLKDVYRSGRRLSRSQLARFRRKGTIWPEAGALDVLRWPSGAVVCECMGVTRGELDTARDGSETSIVALSRKTGAGTVCGSCRHLLARIAGESAVVPVERERGLLVASVVAVAFSLVTLFSSPVPLADSVRAGPLDALWRTSFWKQFTGYALALLCALSLVLSLR
jgi:nitrite reductase (NADH) large subunit